MARKRARPPAAQQVTHDPLQNTSRACGSRMRMGHHSHRTVTTLAGVTRLTRQASIAAAIRRVRATISQRVRRKRGPGPCRMENSAWT